MGLLDSLLTLVIALLNLFDAYHALRPSRVKAGSQRATFDAAFSELGSPNARSSSTRSGAPPVEHAAGWSQDERGTPPPPRQQQQRLGSSSRRERLRAHLTLAVVWYCWRCVEAIGGGGSGLGGGSGWLPWVVPFYGTGKLALLLWLLAGRERAARSIFDALIAPALRPYEPVLDALFGRARHAAALVQLASALSAARLAHAAQSAWHRAFAARGEAHEEPENDGGATPGKLRAKLVPPPPPAGAQAAPGRRSPDQTAKRRPGAPGAGHPRAGGSGGAGTAARAQRAISSHALRAQAHAQAQAQAHAQAQAQAQVQAQAQAASYAALGRLPAPPAHLSAPAGAAPSPPHLPFALRNYAFIPPGAGAGAGAGASPSAASASGSAAAPAQHSPDRTVIEHSPAGSARARAHYTPRRLDAAQVLARHEYESSRAPQPQPQAPDALFSPHMPGFLVKTPYAHIPAAAEAAHLHTVGGDDEDEGSEDEDADSPARADPDDTFAHARTAASSSRRKRTAPNPAASLSATGSDRKRRPANGRGAAEQSGSSARTVPPRGFTVLESDSDAPSGTDSVATRETAASQRGVRSRKTSTAAAGAAAGGPKKLRKTSRATSASASASERREGGREDGQRATTPRAKTNGRFPSGSARAPGEKGGVRALELARGRHVSTPALGAQWLAAGGAAHGDDGAASATSASAASDGTDGSRQQTRRRKVPNSSSLAPPAADAQQTAIPRAARALRSSKSMAGM